MIITFCNFRGIFAFLCFVFPSLSLCFSLFPGLFATKKSRKERQELGAQPTRGGQGGAKSPPTPSERNFQGCQASPHLMGHTTALFSAQMYRGPAARTATFICASPIPDSPAHTRFIVRLALGSKRGAKDAGEPLQPQIVRNPDQTDPRNLQLFSRAGSLLFSQKFRNRPC